MNDNTNETAISDIFEHLIENMSSNETQIVSFDEFCNDVFEQIYNFVYVNDDEYFILFENINVSDDERILINNIGAVFCAQMNEAEAASQRDETTTLHDEISEGLHDALHNYVLYLQK